MSEYITIAGIEVPKEHWKRTQHERGLVVGYETGKAEKQAENNVLKNRIRILEAVIHKHCPEQKMVKLSKP